MVALTASTVICGHISIAAHSRVCEHTHGVRDQTLFVTDTPLVHFGRWQTVRHWRPWNGSVHEFVNRDEIAVTFAPMGPSIAITMWRAFRCHSTRPLVHRFRVTSVPIVWITGTKLVGRMAIGWAANCLNISFWNTIGSDGWKAWKYNYYCYHKTLYYRDTKHYIKYRFQPNIWPTVKHITQYKWWYINRQKHKSKPRV